MSNEALAYAAGWYSLSELVSPMQLLSLSLPSAAENLALDEALLEDAETSELPKEMLRIWESPELAVVLGRSSKVEVEVNIARCSERHAPILRRCSGGATVVIGPGCLMYSLVLSYEQRPHLRALDQAHKFVLSNVASALQAAGQPATMRGTSDLAVSGQKVSGNSLRCKREHLLYHGTLLYDFDLSAIEDLLREPPRQPDYRERRPHGKFVRNIGVIPEQFAAALAGAFGAKEVGQHSSPSWPLALTEQFLAQRYTRDDWNLRL